MSEVKVKSDEITILPPELEEKVEQEISQALVEANATEELIGKMEEEFMKLTIRDNDDKEGYLVVKETRKGVKRARVFAEKVFKKGREEQNLIVKKWLARQNSVIPRFSKIEDYLEVQEKDYEKAEADRKAAEKAKLDQQAAERMRDLISFGARMEGLYWVLGDLQYEVALIREADPEIYADVRDQYKAIFDEGERVKREEEEKAVKEREELAALREKQAEADRILKEREADLLRREEAARQKAEDERIAAEKKIEKEMKDARFEPRKAQLLDMGFRQYNGVDFSLDHTWSTYWEQVYNMDDKEWPEYLKNIQEAVERRAIVVAEEEKKLAASLEKARLEGIGKERQRILVALDWVSSTPNFDLSTMGEDEWFAYEQTAKRSYEKRQKELAEKAEKDRQELLSEKQRYDELVAKIRAIEIPAFRSGQYRAKISIIRDFIDGLK